MLFAFLRASNVLLLTILSSSWSSSWTFSSSSSSLGEARGADGSVWRPRPAVRPLERRARTWPRSRRACRRRRGEAAWDCRSKSTCSRRCTAHRFLLIVSESALSPSSFTRVFYYSPAHMMVRNPSAFADAHFVGEVEYSWLKTATSLDK